MICSLSIRDSEKTKYLYIGGVFMSKEVRETIEERVEIIQEYLNGAAGWKDH